jgi:hypothetical protein
MHITTKVDRLNAELKEMVFQNEGRMEETVIGCDTKNERQRTAPARTVQFIRGPKITTNVMQLRIFEWHVFF